MHDLSRFLQPVPGLFVGGATRIGLGTRLPYERKKCVALSHLESGFAVKEGRK